MQISVVIPTCNRKARLLSLLKNLDQSTYPIDEVIIVDSGDDILSENEYSSFKNLNIQYLQSERSVCIQRNMGIQKAGSDWILLCDDDIEIPVDYLNQLTDHIAANPNAGAVSGLWLQKKKGDPVAIGWKATYPENSAIQLLWKYIFKLGIWGEINASSKNWLIKKIKQYYRKKGNHISKAGWPVLTDFSGKYFSAPIYSLGASLVKKEWLIRSPFDEVLDRHGIGDNYGVLVDFPENIHVLNDVFVYHHREPMNRLQKSLQYYRRALALDYFIRTKESLRRIKRRWLVWSLIGNMISFILSPDKLMIRAAFKSAWMILRCKNPYVKAAKEGKKIIEPGL